MNNDFHNWVHKKILSNIRILYHNLKNRYHLISDCYHLHFHCRNHSHIFLQNTNRRHMRISYCKFHLCHIGDWDDLILKNSEVFFLFCDSLRNHLRERNQITKIFFSKIDEQFCCQSHKNIHT